MTFDSTAMFAEIEEIQPITKVKKWGPDERFWKLSRNKDDNGAAQIRLLPNVVEKEGKGKVMVPFVKVFEHNLSYIHPIEQKKKYFIEDSPSTIGERCVCSDLYNEIRNDDSEGAKALKEIVKRKTKFITNIYVVKDPIAPNNDGRFALWSFGTKLQEKFSGIISPTKDDIAMGSVAVNLYDVVNGASFNLKIKRAGDFLNYDSSEMGPKGAVKQFANNEEVQEFIDNGYELTEWLKSEHYIDYEDAKAKLRRFFEGSEHEKFLKASNSFLYEGVDKPATEQELPTQSSVPETSGLVTPSMDRVV